MSDIGSHYTKHFADEIPSAKGICQNAWQERIHGTAMPCNSGSVSQQGVCRVADMCMAGIALLHHGLIWSQQVYSVTIRIL